MKKYLSVLCLFLFAACGQSSNQEQKNSPAFASDDKQVIDRLLRSKMPDLPPGLIGGSVVEIRLGAQGGFASGPDDYVQYMRVNVDSAHLDAWLKKLSPQSPPPYEAPLCKCAWWVSAEDFRSLVFFDVSGFSARQSGWIGVSRKTSTIYLTSSTM